MRLTLRTLLAYLDDTIEATEIKQIGQKVAESETARELIARIKSVTRRRRLTTPPLAGDADKFDPNTIAEYLDNTLSAEQVAEVEQICLDSDVHLAEIATCHQILTLVLGEPALVPPSAKRRMVALVKGRSSGIRKNVPAAAAPRRLEESGEDDALLLGLPPMGPGQRAWLRWLLPVAGCLLLAGLVAAVVMALPKKDEDSAKTRRDRRGADSGTAVATADRGKQGTPATAGEGKDGKDSKNGKDDGTPVKDGKDTPEKDKTDNGVKPPIEPVNPNAGSTKAPAWSAAPPSPKRQIVGKFVRNNAWQDVLMQGQGDTGKWQRLVSGANVGTNDFLVSLPGYRSELVLNNGVRLLLWGNVGQQLSEGPILESAVVLHAAEPDKTGGLADLDFTISRGRVWIINQKKGDMPAFVRLRFHKEIWDMTLQPGAEVGMEMVGREVGLKQTRAEEEPATSLWLVVKKGTVNIRDDLREFPPLIAPATFGWNNTEGTAPGPRPLEPWPPYWEQPVQMKMGAPAAQEMGRALDALQKRLTENRAIGALLVETLDAAEGGAGRFLTVLCFGALDDVDSLADALANERYPDVRDAAVEALRHWLGRNGGQRERFRSVLDKKFTKGTDVDAVLRLLRIPGSEDLGDLATYSIPVDELASDRVAIRHLAFWHLQRLANKEMRENKLSFDPVATPEQRDFVQKKWKKLLDDDKLPPREFRKGGGAGKQ